MTGKMNLNRHIFGPIASRRLGRSLGVDLVPYKTCSLDCAYCECGVTTDRTIERRVFFPENEITEPLTEILSSSASDLDAVTFSGSGEPTLSASLGRIAEHIKNRTMTPVVLLTNGTLLFQKDVIDDIQWIDIIIPSLDAADSDMFKRINRPHPDLSFSKYINGLTGLRQVFHGRIWLEILLCRSVNDEPSHLSKLASITDRINPDLVQLNTLARPGADRSLKPLTREDLERAATYFSQPVQIFAVRDEISVSGFPSSQSDLAVRILDIVERRPSSISELALGLRTPKENLIKTIRMLMMQGSIVEIEQDGEHYFQSSREHCGS